MDYNNFTTAQLKLLEVLEDGMPHHRDELQSKLPDELAGRNALANMLCNMRKILRPQGHDIICEWHRRMYHYRHVRLLARQYDE